MKYLMGVDIGTSSAKSILMTTTGVVVAEAQQTYTIQEPAPGYRVQNANEVLQAILHTMQHAIADMPERGELAAIGFSSAMHSLMAVDVHGEPLTDLMLWADTRSSKQCAIVKNSPLANDLYKLGGVPIHPMTPLCKIMWLKSNEPTVFAAAHKFISIKEYLFFKLTGEYVIDHSIASSTGLFNIYTLQWHQPALQMAGIGNQQLSTPVSVYKQFFAIQERLKQWLGLDTPVPLVAGSSDGCLANLGSGVTENGGIAVTISTSMAVRITSSIPYHDEAQSLFNYAIDQNRYVCGGGSNSGSLLLKWMATNILQSEALQDPERFMEKALTAPAGCDGLLFLPYLLGERAPVWDADATGVIVGFRFHHQQQHLMRALIEGLTMNAYMIIERLLPVAGTNQVIKASGGFTNSAQWLQMLADVSNLTVEVDSTADASAMGAVMVAGFSVGIFETLDTPLGSKQEKTSYKPNQTQHVLYQRNYAIFKQLHAKNKQH